MDKFDFDNRFTEEEFDLKQYLSIIFKKRWIFFSILAVVMVTTSIFTFKQTPIYRATATILIEPTWNVPSFSATQDQRITPRLGGSDYYSTQYSILHSAMLAKRVCEVLNLPFSPDALRNITRIEPVRNTRLVKVNIDYEDPVMAKEIANTLVNVYIEQNVESMLFMSKEILKAFPEKREEIERHTVYGQLKELSKEEVIESLPPIANDPLLRGLKSDKVKTETQLANLSKRYKDKHPKIVTLRAELEFVNDKIEIETDKILRGVKADLAGRLQANNIRVIEYAEVPQRPIKPKKMKNMLYGLFLSTFLGIGVIFFTEYLDDTIKNQNDIEKKLSLPFLGHFPLLEKQDKDIYDFEKLDKDHDASVAIRNIKTNILFSLPKDDLKKILITSAIPQEGKSVLAGYVAYAFAKNDIKTLLLDADIRKPRLHETFSIDRSPGLTNLLVENLKPQDVIKKTKYKNIYIMPSGSKTPNPLELLNSNKMENLISELSTVFDRIIIDTAPGLMLPDALVLSRLSDATLFVTKAASVSRDVLYELRDKFAHVNSKIIGIILNFFKTNEHMYYKYKYYHKYYKDYYSK